MSGMRKSEMKGLGGAWCGPQTDPKMGDASLPHLQVGRCLIPPTQEVNAAHGTGQNPPLHCHPFQEPGSAITQPNGKRIFKITQRCGFWSSRHKLLLRPGDKLKRVLVKAAGTPLLA